MKNELSDVILQHIQNIITKPWQAVLTTTGANYGDIDTNVNTITINHPHDLTARGHNIHIGLHNAIIFAYTPRPLSLDLNDPTSIDQLDAHIKTITAHK